MKDIFYSPCCINSLAKPLGLSRYYCVKCGRIWKIEEQEQTRELINRKEKMREKGQ
jgi:hypothetical protein